MRKYQYYKYKDNESKKHKKTRLKPSNNQMVRCTLKYSTTYMD